MPSRVVVAEAAELVRRILDVCDLDSPQDRTIRRRLEGAEAAWRLAAGLPIQESR